MYRLSPDTQLSAIEAFDYLGCYFTTLHSVYNRKFVVVTEAKESGCCSFSDLIAVYSTSYVTICECPQRTMNISHGRLVSTEQGKILLLSKDGTVWEQTGQHDTYLVEIA